MLELQVGTARTSFVERSVKAHRLALILRHVLRCPIAHKPTVSE